MEGEIIYLNVGGTRFCTSKQTLTWIPDTFFTSLLSGRILSLMDESGAIFIDRDPQLFSQVLNFLRTKEVSLKNVDLKGLHDEAQYYGITPLVWRLALCGDLDVSSCGDALFHECIQPPVPPNSIINSGLSSSEGTTSSSTVLNSVCNQEEDAKNRQDCMCSLESRPGASTGAASYDMKHSRSSPDAVDSISNTIDSGGGPVELLCVMMVKGHYNWICASYSHFICLYRMIDLMGWQLAWTSGYLTQPVVLVAINARLATSALESIQQMVAATFSSVVRLWSITEDGDSQDVGVFNMDVSVDYLFFIGSQLVALSQMGKVGVWHSMTQHWRTQDVAPISSYEVAGTFLLLGCQNGSIYYIDMQKFPLRMKDNDLLVTELYKDQTGAVVTALSVYLAPKTVSNGGLSGNWLEVAYGTSSGAVRVIVHHPETAGHEPKLFQTFLVHRSPITKVVLSKKHLISVCSDYNHVRTWSVTRFRGLISTQPGSKPLASFKVVSLEDVEPPAFHSVGNHFGPYGEQDDMQVFVQKVVPHTDRLFIRMAYSGQRVCVIKSVDGSTICSFCVHECEGSSRLGSRPRRYLFTGHVNGSIQIWDLSTAIECMHHDDTGDGGPNWMELLRLLEHCDLSLSSDASPCISSSSQIGPSHFPLQQCKGSIYRLRRHQKPIDGFTSDISQDSTHVNNWVSVGWRADGEPHPS